MIVKEYLQGLKKNQEITFIIAKAVKDESTPFYHTEYKTVPVRSAHEWLTCKGQILELLVINKDHSPIDITGDWCNLYKSGHLKCCMIADKDYLSNLYSEKQAKEMEEHYKSLLS